MSGRGLLALLVPTLFLARLLEPFLDLLVPWHRFYRFQYSKLHRYLQEDCVAYSELHYAMWGGQSLKFRKEKIACKFFQQVRPSHDIFPCQQIVLALASR